MSMILISNLFAINAYSQTMYDYKKKTPSNEVDRTKILDILRANLYQDYQQEFIFVVNTLNVSANYAWFKGNVQRKDGRAEQMRKELDATFKEKYDDFPYDCCHVEALLKKSGEKWYIVAMEEFSTDIWWDGIWDNHPNAPKKIFSY